MNLSPEFIARFYAKARIVKRSLDTECWEWTGHRTGSGHGQVKLAGKTQIVHRVSWLASKSEQLPPVVRHICDNAPCFRPEHLEAGDHLENVADRVKRNRSACGSRNGRSRLNQQQITEIRLSQDPVPALGTRYGITPSAVYKIRSGKRWKSLPIQ